MPEQSDTDLCYPLQTDTEFPELFPSPFEVRPHAVAAQAAASLQMRLPALCNVKHAFDAEGGGKMFGVLVVKNQDGQTGYLSAFSGMLGQHWHCNGFVPPVFDQSQRETVLSEGERQLLEYQRNIDTLKSDADYQAALAQLEKYTCESEAEIKRLRQEHKERKLNRNQLRQQADINNHMLKRLADESRSDKAAFKQLKQRCKEGGVAPLARVAQCQSRIDLLAKQRKQLSRQLQTEVFDGYRLCDSSGQRESISRFFKDALPPSGAGDCAAVKLVHYANLNQLHPIALAEFWWGTSPAGGLRQHGRYYPACRSRCRVLLPWLLNGLTLAIPAHEKPVDYGDEYPLTLHEDEDIVLVEKPAGMLSVPGSVVTDSVESRLKARYPQVAGVMLLHRLDQATSGVMIAAKHPGAYKNLQHQFQDRTINKRYIAVLDGVVEENSGEINLPLRLDYYDRPRQMVCDERGKPALTRYEVLSKDTQTTRVAFYPHTGRTHQLRVHSAHADGLNIPILGDELYGRPLDRLYLHAEQLCFYHPVSGLRLSVSSTVTF